MAYYNTCYHGYYYYCQGFDVVSVRDKEQMKHWDSLLKQQEEEEEEPGLCNNEHYRKDVETAVFAGLFVCLYVCLCVCLFVCLYRTVL